MWEQAVAYCRQASAKASARSANRETVAYLEQALAALQHLLESRDTRAQDIELRLELRNALHPLGEYRQIHDCLHEAERLAEALGDPRRLSRVSALLGHHFHWIGDHEHAIERLQHALAIACDLGDLGCMLLQLIPNFFLGEAHFALGNYRQATRALALAEELGMRPLQAQAHRGLGILYTKIGRREQAREELSTAIALYCAMEMQFWLPQAETALVQVT
jgi:tetratricopeptide (TPR) repeat protein